MRKLVVAVVLCIAGLSVQAAEVPTNWLLADKGPAWWYKASPADKVTSLGIGAPTSDMIMVKTRAIAAKGTALVLVDGSDIVHKEVFAPATADSTFFGFSIGKTVAAMAAGKAICDGKLSLTTKVKALLPELNETHLGEATVKDLLTMSSGATDGATDGSLGVSLMSREELARWQQGNLGLLELVTNPKRTTAQRGVFSTYKPGERFSYKGTDPVVLGMMISRATNMTYASWVQARVFNEMGMEHKALIVQDKNGHALAESGVRLKLDDWVRFAVWVKQSSRENSCFGQYVREATTTQIQNGSSPQDRRTGHTFGGYGYLVWTENAHVPQTFWARGLGGQAIGWSTKNNRAIVVFGTSESWVPEVYELANRWLNGSN